MAGCGNLKAFSVSFEISVSIEMKALVSYAFQAKELAVT
jgi:hypothetical protein